MEIAQAIDNDVIDSNADTDQYLTFLLAGEEYGVDILRVQEIKGWDNVTPIPNTPSYVKGVINLRGTIIPIIDLRQRFGIPGIAYGPMTVVIVLKVIGDERERTMGIVVDGVSDVYNVAAGDMKPAPDFGAVDIGYVNGLATVDNKMVIVLNIDALLNSLDVEAEEVPQQYQGQGAVAEDVVIPQASSPKNESLEIELLETSFAALAPKAGELAQKFYEELFKRCPAVKPMFANIEIEEQQQKLVAALGTVISSLRSPDELAKVLSGLGAQHKQYGAMPEHYQVVGETLLDVMAEVAGGIWSPKLASAWRAAINTVAGMMMKAYG